MKRKCSIIFTKAQTESSTRKNFLSIPPASEHYVLHSIQDIQEFGSTCTKFYTVWRIYWTKLTGSVLWIVNVTAKVQNTISANNSGIWSATHKLWRLSTKSDLLFKFYWFLACVKSLDKVFSNFYNIVQSSDSHKQGMCNTEAELRCTYYTLCKFCIGIK